MSEENYTKFEVARMLGSRALQISMGAPFLVKLSEKQLEEIAFNPIAIAKLELEHDALPWAGKRPVPGEKSAAAKAAA